jgi:A/G-specific adenine glycosylase
MLQQTNVPKVIEKYKEFLRVFPSVRDLAQAKQSAVLQQWSGLGYNRRAIYLHKMAQEIVQKHKGRFPHDPEQLIKLHGIGPYTSKSILIFACNTDIATRDVNIDRIMRRVHKQPLAVEDRIVQWIDLYLPLGRSRDWHNALMDFASVICTKRSPTCDVCPIKAECRSFPSPQDAIIVKKKEIGRSECGRDVPRRIYRGRIIEYLRTQNGTANVIGQAIKKDWKEKSDLKWCEEVLQGLKKDHMIDDDHGGIWHLR